MSHSSPALQSPDSPAASLERRAFLERLSSYCMGAGLLSGYGAFGWLMARFIYPAGSVGGLSWRFVSDLAGFAPGRSRTFVSPAGQKIVITRRGETGDAADFIALSSVCPHLGCQVHWELANNRFFCPCHNGAFDVEGRPTAGPPKDAGQSLARYPLKVENGLLFIETAQQALVSHEPSPGPFDAQIPARGGSASASVC